MASQEFEEDLVALIPTMRIWALSMTRNRAAGDDLAQDTAARALTACDSFLPGTNFKAWVRRIMINYFISGKRSGRPFVDEMPEQPVLPSHIDKIAVAELGQAMDRLQPDQRKALFAVAVDEKSYKEVAHETGCAIGTLKSRVHRARLQLRSHMDGAQPLAA
jgi:RNA polymerase sigma-70 factor (ECF subfamily)